jgi:type I site-specific restriction endonuclease
VDKAGLSERDICTKYITPAVRRAGWDVMSQVREEVSFTKGRIIVRGKLVSRGKAKRADYVLYYKPNIPLALIEAKDNSYGVGDAADVIEVTAAAMTSSPAKASILPFMDFMSSSASGAEHA